MTYEIYNENCLAGMKSITNGSVDMILTDLPYGTTDCCFDKRIPFEPMWAEFKRVTKLNAPIVLFSQMPFGAELIMSNRKMFRYEWVWHKSLPVGFLNAKKMPMRIHENILVFYRKLPTYNPQFTKDKPYFRREGSRPTANYEQHKRPAHTSDGRRYPTDTLKFPQPIASSKKLWHPQQKPTALLEYLILTYTNEGETVLDATMGSGSTGVACVNTGRRFIGFELDEHHYYTARKRISEALAEKQQELF